MNIDPLRIGRQAVEDSLGQKVVVDHFPLASAGQPLKDQQRADAMYDQDARKASGNPYAPFASRLDWEVARWAKLRGPGSNALSELLGIDGVRYPALYCCQKLTMPIDTRISDALVQESERTQPNH